MNFTQRIILYKKVDRHPSFYIVVHGKILISTSVFLFYFLFKLYQRLLIEQYLHTFFRE